MYSIQIYQKLLDSVSSALIEAYNKHFNVNLWEELEKMVKAEKKRMFIFHIFMVPLMMYLLVCVIVMFGYNRTMYDEPMTAPQYLIGIAWLLPIIISFVIFKYKDSKWNNIQDGAGEKLEAFGKVIKDLDPADLRPRPLREVTVLDEVGVRDNILKLTRKLLFVQDILRFAEKSRYARFSEVEEAKVPIGELSRRLSECIKHANSVGVSISREWAVLEVQKACEVTE
jgi:hypothetical protein